MIPELRTQFNRCLHDRKNMPLCWLARAALRRPIDFRVAETPIFHAASSSQRWRLPAWISPTDLSAMPPVLRPRAPPFLRATWSPETAHPNFVTADFALVQRLRTANSFPGLWKSRHFPLYMDTRQYSAPVTAMSFNSSPGWAHSSAASMKSNIGSFLAKTVLAGHDPENVVLTELDPLHQKTRPDFDVTAARLGIAVVDIRTLEAIGNKLHYRDARGRLVPIHRIYNRAIADELMARNVRLPFDLDSRMGCGMGRPSQLVLPHQQVLHSLALASARHPLSCLRPSSSSDFLDGPGREQLAAAGVPLPPIRSGHGLQRTPAQAALLLRGQGNSV